MQYLISFLEGTITFISPCLLPLLPAYITFFAANKSEKPWLGALSFITGFSLVFMTMGAFAGAIGSLLVTYRTLVDAICGAVVIFLGLNFIGLIKLGLFNGGTGTLKKGASLLESFVFGIVFSISWTPCVGAFLGSALMLAGAAETMSQGLLLLLFYCLGLGLPLFLSSLLIDRLGNAIAFLKNHYNVIRIVCGIFLIATGILMAAGVMGGMALSQT